MLLQGKEAGAQFTVGSQAKAIAGVAEVFADGTDDPDLAQGGGKTIKAGRAVAVLADRRQQRCDPVEPFEHGIRRHQPIVPFFSLERHELDKAHFKGIVVGQAGQVFDFIIIDPAHDDGIELDR